MVYGECEVAVYATDLNANMTCRPFPTYKRMMGISTRRYLSRKGTKWGKGGCGFRPSAGVECAAALNELC